MALSLLCSFNFLLFLFVLSAVPIAVLISLERAQPATHVYHYHSTGWFRESAKWDALHRRFLVSFLEGGVSQISVPDDLSPGTVLTEVTVIKDADLAGNASVGITIDRPRNRLLVVNVDFLGARYSALAAYDLSTWDRLFLTQLSGSREEKSFADDVAVDAEGTSYVTDAKGSKIWKIGVNGELVSVITSPIFRPKEWYKSLVGLNGIVYHPDGFLLVIHTFSGNLYKIDVSKGDEIIMLVKVSRGSLIFGDGIELVSESKLVVAGNPSGRLVESCDGWETAYVVDKFSGPTHRLATSVTVKDEKVYLSHLIGMGYPRKTHALVEAVFSA